jgi:hypothetical protein
MRSPTPSRVFGSDLDTFGNDDLGICDAEAEYPVQVGFQMFGRG